MSWYVMFAVQRVRPSSRCVMVCHVLHAVGACAADVSGMGLCLSPSLNLARSCPAARPPALSREWERRYCFAGRFASLKLCLSVFRMSFPPSRFVLPAARLPGAADPDSRVSCAPAPAPARARLAAARIARLIARARDGGRTSPVRSQGSFAPERKTKQPPDAASFLLPHTITGARYVKYIIRNISLMPNIWQSSSRGPACRPKPSGPTARLQEFAPAP